MTNALKRGIVAARFQDGVGITLADDYPSRAITVIVPFGAGGPSDIAIRSIGDRLSQTLGQPIVIENSAGAGGMTGAAKAAHAAPDGYTLLLHQNGLVISPALNPNQPLDVAKDLTAVGMVNASYLFLVGKTSIPAKNLSELVEWMRGPGKPAKIAHPGLGGTLGAMSPVLGRVRQSFKLAQATKRVAMKSPIAARNMSGA